MKNTTQAIKAAIEEHQAIVADKVQQSERQGEIAIGGFVTAFNLLHPDVDEQKCLTDRSQQDMRMAQIAVDSFNNAFNLLLRDA